MAEANNEKNILNQSLDQVMSDRFGRYSKYIIQERALPDARDGLKPVQRRIIYSMSELGLLANKPFKKSARVVGEVIGKYHPHGDSSIYEAMVRMSQNWKMNIPLIEMHGNNGSIDDDPAAAMRYTEARLSEISNFLIKDIKRDTVLFAPNFDDSEKEPTVLPAIFPNLLVNGARGIAAGYATEMPPHNLGEVIDGIIAKIKSPNIRLETLLGYIKGPDFPTGGTVMGSDGIYQAFERGRGKIAIRSKYEVNDQKTKPWIKITEIPFGVVKSKLVREIDELRINNKIDGIKEVRDETDRNGLSIMIDITPGKEIKPILNYLLSKTDMQIYYNYNNISIKDKVPTQMSIISLIDAYLSHQKDVQRKALSFTLKKDKKRLEIVEGLIKVAQISDKIIDLIKSTKESKKGVVAALKEKFNFTELQATAIAELRLYRLSQTDQGLYKEEKEVLLAKIANVEKTLGSKNEFNNYLISLLKELKSKFATERKSIIEDELGIINIDMHKLIKHENIWVGISAKGYIKRFSNRVYEANKIEDYFLNQDDTLISLDMMNTKDKLIVFTSKGNYYSIPGHKIVETKFKDGGKHLNDFAVLSHDETIVSSVMVKDFSVNAFVLLVTKEGKGKRVTISSFDNARHTRLYRAMKLSTTDALVNAKVSNGRSMIIVINKSGKAVHYSESQLPVQSTSSGGSKAISLNKNEVTAFGVVSRNSQIGIISSRGGIKRLKQNNIIPMSRKTQGKTIFRSLKGNPHIAIDVARVTSKSYAYFSKNGLIPKRFNEVDITTRDDGFTLLNLAKVNGGFIQANHIVSSEDDFFKKAPELSEADKFANAEKAIEQVAQIDLDELLKGNN